jgi:hypothetical protein
MNSALERKNDSEREINGIAVQSEKVGGIIESDVSCPWGCQMKLDIEKLCL